MGFVERNAIALVLMALFAQALCHERRRMAEDDAAIYGGKSYFPSSCASKCTPKTSFMQPLPVLPSLPDTAGIKSPVIWGEFLLSVIRKNQPKLSPPAVARHLGVFGTCLFDAIAIAAPEYRWSPNNAAKSAFAAHVAAASSPVNLDAVVSGAAHSFIILVFPDDASHANNMASTVLGANFAQNKWFNIGSGVAAVVLAARDSDGHASTVAYTLEVVNGGPLLRNTLTGNTYPRTPQAGVYTCDAIKPNPYTWQPLCVDNNLRTSYHAVAADGQFPPYKTVPTNVSGTAVLGACSQQFLGLNDASAKPFVSETETIAGALPEPYAGRAERRGRDMAGVAKESAGLNDITKVIAEYWADGPDSTFPPGHWFHIATLAARDSRLSTPATVELLMSVGNALHDAGIGSWSVKAKWKSLRPVQALQCANAETKAALRSAGLLRGDNVYSWKGPYMGTGLRPLSTWSPYQRVDFITPPFPGYISGHSSFSAAAAEVLTLFFAGDSSYRGPPCYLFQEGASAVEPMVADPNDPRYLAGVTDVAGSADGHRPGYAPSRDVVLCYDSWSQAATQSGVSRIYGGIHPSLDDSQGQKLGRAVARAVIRQVRSLTKPEKHGHVH